MSGELRLKVATVWRGEWNADVAYNVLDEVSFSAEVEGVKRGNYRSLLAANREPLGNENAWVLVLDLEKTQSATEEAETMNKAFASAESSRVKAESERVTAENSRVEAESKRVTAENSRVEAEGKRLSAESGRADAETNRRIAEETRLSNEQARVSAENSRNDAEGNRRTAEAVRISNEQARVEAENSRVAAEAGRANAFAAAQIEREEAFNAAEAGRDAKIDAKVEDITRLQGEVAKKANIDGYYSSMAVGAAESLIGQNVTTQQFTFQSSGNTLDVQDGLAVVKSIKGNTVVANQLVNGSETLTLISGRKYYLNIQGVASIITVPSEQVLEVNAGDIVIDLTKFFNAGSMPTSVEEFERLYPNLPTEYNEGSLLNFNADSIKSVGFNAFNGEYAKVLGGMQYYLGGNITSLVFKENLEDEGEIIEIPTDNLYTPNTNGYIVASGDNICINLSHSGYRNGEYEPYKESIANLPIKKYFPDGMKSAGEVKDEIVWDEGLKKYKAIQRIGSVDMGNLTWHKSSTDGIFGVSFPVNEDEIYFALSDIICQNYLTVKTQESLLKTNKSVLNAYYYYRGLNIHDDDAWNTMTVKEFKSYLSGKYLYYKLANPIETIIDDYDLIDYEVSDFGTEEIIANEPTTPIITEVIYSVNAVDTLRRLPQNYISADSMRDFLAQLSSAMNGSWTMVFDDVNNKWEFAFSANKVVNNEE